MCYLYIFLLWFKQVALFPRAIPIPYIFENDVTVLICPQRYTNINDFLYYFLQFLPIDAKPPSKPPRGAYLSGLRLHNALWDSSKSALMEPLTPEHCNSAMPVIWLKPIDKFELERKRNEVKHHLYNCPIYTSPSNSCTSWINIVGTIELPSTRQPSLWAQKSVIISCALQEFL